MLDTGVDNAQPLAGIRVLDLSGDLGVYCGKLMADMGADVIKVEPPGGDGMRRTGPFVNGVDSPDSSLHWLHYNTNKRSITLDIASDAGSALLRRLAGNTDVQLESFAPGYLDSLGLGYGHLSEGNPGLVYASLTPFGQTGPYRDYRGSDLVGFAMGGYMYVTGWPHTPPNKLWGSQAFHTTSNRAFIGILIALYHRLATGQGQHVDVSMQEAVATTTEHVNTAYNYTGESAVRCGFRHGGQFVATWQCRDGYALSVVGGPASNTARGLGQRHNWNAGKMSISLNMKTGAGKDLACRLMAVSDVVAENFSGRVMPGWGLDFESIRQIRPDIIMLSMSGFGRTGPWKDRVSYGQTLQAWSGFTDLTGFPESQPSGPASAYSDAVAGMAGAQAVLLALIQRTHTGQSQWIDVSQMEAMSALLGPLALELSANKSQVQRSGNRLAHGGGVPHGAYRCQGDDRWLAITVLTDDDWAAFTGAIGSPEWTSDQRFASAESRLSNADELDSLVESWTSEQNPDEAMHLLQTAGVAAGVVQTGEDLAENDPHLKERELFQKVPDAAGVLRTIERAPYKLSRTPGGVTRGAPEFGGDQTFVLSEILGVDDEELAEMAIAGAFD